MRGSQSGDGGEELGGGEEERMRRGKRRRGSQSANQSITVTPHLDPAIGHSFLEADRGADSVKYHKLVRSFRGHPVEQDMHSL